MIYVSWIDVFQNLILREAHREVYMAHLGVKNMNMDLKPLFFWNKRKKDIVNYVSRYLEFQQEKVEHRHPTILLQLRCDVVIEWKVILMDFTVKLPMMSRIHDSFL
jgi:hypothetical protein